MFMLTTISDLVQIVPERFNDPVEQSIEDFINAKYSNKVVQNVGLCICIFDILYISDGRVGQGTGIVNVNAEFRLVVFRPFEGEIVSGRIAGASDLGIRVHLDFFNVMIPPHLMFINSKFKVQEQVWIWNNEGEEYYYDKGLPVRIRIEAENFVDTSPIGPSDLLAEKSIERKAPYSLTASMMQAGLGPIEWW